MSKPIPVSYYFSEFFGTFTMMFIGIAAIILNFGTSITSSWIPDPSLRLLLTGIIFASGATLVVYSPVGKISGAHINPAVSMAFWLNKKITFTTFLRYAFVQTLGSWVAIIVLNTFWHESLTKVAYGMTLPGEGYGLFFVFITEILITFLLVTTILAGSHFKKIVPFLGLIVGILVAILVFLTAPISGTSLNPARSWGPALVAENLSNQWLYLIAPLVGSGLAFLLTKSLRPLCAKLNHASVDKNCPYNCKF